jgi:hypothetical protein
MDLGSRIASVTVTGAVLVLAGHLLTSPSVVALDSDGWAACHALAEGSTLPDRTLGCLESADPSRRLVFRQWGCQDGPRLFAWERDGHISFTVNGLIRTHGSTTELEAAIAHCTGTPRAEPRNAEQW